MRKYIVTEYDIEDYDSVENNMTNEQAVSILNFIARGHIPDYNYACTEDDFENFKLHVALWKAIEALGGKPE